MRYTDVSDYWRALARYYEAADALVAMPSSTEWRGAYRELHAAVGDEIERVFHAAMRHGRMGRVEAQ